jgi:REP element-mobilizing transposase RayT
MYLSNSRTGYFVTMQDEPSQLRHAALRRLTQVWIDSPIFFLTVCVQARRELLASEAVHAVLREVWETGHQRHGWQVGRYVIMPDHVHLFCAAGRHAASLSTYVGAWKQWSSKFLRH